MQETRAMSSRYIDIVRSFRTGGDGGAPDDQMEETKLYRSESEIKERETDFVRQAETLFERQETHSGMVFRNIMDWSATRYPGRTMECRMSRRGVAQTPHHESSRFDASGYCHEDVSKTSHPDV